MEAHMKHLPGSASSQTIQNKVEHFRVPGGSIWILFFYLAKDLIKRFDRLNLKPII
jgi:hypothetical protein